MKKQILILIPLLFSFTIYAQLGGGNNGNAQSVELPTIVPPPPTVANLMKFEEVPVSHYTGQPDISIPLYSKQISSTLSLDFASAYNTRGIKLRSYSGWVGTGWNLSGGGVVSMTIRDLPYEKRKRKNGVGGVNGIGSLNNTDFWKFENATYSRDRHAFLYNANGSNKDKYDFQSDLIQFSVLELSERIVIISETGNLVKAKLLTENLNNEINVDAGA